MKRIRQPIRSLGNRLLRAMFRSRHGQRSVLFSGQAYYSAWYLSRELRRLGWRADVVNWDTTPGNEIYYHGEDVRLGDSRFPLWRHARFYLHAVRHYEIFHFSNVGGIRFGHPVAEAVAKYVSPGAEIRLLKRIGKVIVYSNNGCHDGVSQSSFARWRPGPVCADCRWRDEPSVCSDERNLAWGAFRNSVADYQILLGGNRADYNIDDRIHEVPEFYCLDEDVWHPELAVPARFRLPYSQDTVKIYHGVGGFERRTDAQTLRNIKSTHIYVPLIEQLKHEGYNIELMFFDNVPNLELRYYQAQADIFVDMLTYGFVGATAREAMMLGKPVIAYLRPQWLESMREEIPAYVDDLPVVSATPETVRAVLIDLIEHPDKRRELGDRGREFAVKWHSSRVAAERIDAIYRSLLSPPRSNAAEPAVIEASAPLSGISG